MAEKSPKKNKTSFLKKLFRNSSKETIGLPSAINNVNDTLDQLMKEEECLKTDIKKQLEIAKQNKQNNKKLSLNALKLKKNKEKRLEFVQNFIHQLENQKTNLDEANINLNVISTLNKASKSLKAANKKASPNQINDLYEKLDEQTEQMNEISNAISESVCFNESFDEDELQNELDALELETLENNLDLPRDLSNKLPNVAEIKNDNEENSTKLKKNAKVAAAI